MTRNQRVSRFAALLAFVLASFALASQAEAETFKVRLDNDLTPSHYANAASAGTIVVDIWTVNHDGIDGSAQSQNRVISSISNTNDFTFNFTQDNFEDICAVRVSITGSHSDDLFILDQFYVYKGDGSIGYVSGAENDLGYCLSSQSSDGSNSHCNPSSASTERIFYPNGYCPT